MRAYHSDPALKERTLALLAAHREADRIVQGTYWSEQYGEFRGCAVGCLLQDPKGGHERYETEFGIPAQLAGLEDGIFEALPIDRAQSWPERFMASIPVGADLSSVWPRFVVWLMIDDQWGIAGTTNDAEVQAICRRVADGYQRTIDGNPLSDEDAGALAWAAQATWAAQGVRDARAAWAAWAAWAARATWATWATWAAWAAQATWATWAAWAAWAAQATWATWAAWVAWAAQGARATWAAWVAQATWAAQGVRDAWAAQGAQDTWAAWAAWAARDAFVLVGSDKLVELLEGAV